jgi:hypothetical protein
MKLYSIFIVIDTKSNIFVFVIGMIIIFSLPTSKYKSPTRPGFGLGPETLIFGKTQNTDPNPKLFFLKTLNPNPVFQYSKRSIRQTYFVEFVLWNVDDFLVNCHESDPVMLLIITAPFFLTFWCIFHILKFLRF